MPLVIALSVSVTTKPATVIAPDRELLVVLLAARKATVPLPVPVAPLVMVSQGALLDAFHVQPAPVEMLMLPATPVDDGFSAPTLAWYEQGAVPAWVTLNCAPSIVSEPVRGLVEVLAATV